MEFIRTPIISYCREMLPLDEDSSTKSSQTVATSYDAVDLRFYDDTCFFLTDHYCNVFDFDVNGRRKMAKGMASSSSTANVKKVEGVAKGKCATKNDSTFSASAIKSAKNSLKKHLTEANSRTTKGSIERNKLRGVKRSFEDEVIHVTQSIQQYDNISAYEAQKLLGYDRTDRTDRTDQCLQLYCKCSAVEDTDKRLKKQNRVKQRPTTMRGKEHLMDKGPSSVSRKKILHEDVDRQRLNHEEPVEVSSIMYKKLHKEHLTLQRSFTAVCQTLNEAAAKSQRPHRDFFHPKQKEIFDKEVDGLNRQIEILSLELQETRDQNELLEFRILELDQCLGKSSTKSVTLANCATNTENIEKVCNFDGIDHPHPSQYIEQVQCTRCNELETRVEYLTNENLKLTERFNGTAVRAQQELSERKLFLSEEIQNLTIKGGNKNETISGTTDVHTTNVQPPFAGQNSSLPIDANCTLRGVEPDAGYSAGSAMTSEDEGLGDDTRRDHSSGPSSMADLQESEYDVITVQSPLSMCMTHVITNVPLPHNEKCSGVNIHEDNGIHEKSIHEKSIHVSSQTEDTSECRTIESQGYIEHLERNLAKLKEEKANLEEQVLELEEAENDARLISQRLQRQIETLFDQYDTIQIDLIDTKTTVELCDNKIKAVEKSETEIRSQINDTRNVMIKYQNDNMSNKTDDTNIKNDKHEELINRITLLEKEDKSLRDQLNHVNGLNSSLWEKLYKLENQIESFKASYGAASKNILTSSHDSDDDLQLFISEDKIKSASRIGSSFDATTFENNGSDPSNYKHCSATNRLDDLVLALPLCETIKPERIDVLMGSPKTRTSPPPILSAEIVDRINQIEVNSNNLKERLMQLEWINKEFVKELELREKIFIEKQEKHYEWSKSENELKETIGQLHAERNELTVKVSALEAERNNLIEQIIAHREVFEETKREHQRELRDAKKEQENVVQNMHKRIDERESKEKEYLNQIKAFNSQRTDEQIKLNHLKDNYEILKEELRQEKENIIKLKEDFANELSNLVNYHISYEKELKERINQMEAEESNYEVQLKHLIERETSLKQILTYKENELNRLRMTHVNRIRILEDEHHLVEKELKMKMQVMEQKTAMTIKELDLERTHIKEELESSLTSLRDKETYYSRQINELKDTVNELHDKISQLENQLNSNELCETMQLKSEITMIKSREDELRAKISVMEQKETAYEETLSKADKIVETLELNYKERIQQLEASERSLKTRINQLEECDARWKRYKRRSGHVSDLVQQLIDSEARECVLREQIEKYETAEKQMKQNIEELTKRLESELRDHEELVMNAVEVNNEIESLKKDLSKSLQSQDSLQEMIKDTEKYCLEREEEMHKKFKLLEDEKCELEITIQRLRHRLRLFDSHGDSFHVLSLSSESNSHEEFMPEQSEEPLCLQLNETPFKHEEVDDACMNMEKCVKRAMIVVQMEMNQKDELSKSPTRTDQAFPSLSSSSPCSSTDDCDNLNDIETLFCDTSDSTHSLIEKSSPPTNFRIIRRVGYDALLVGWNYHRKDKVLGYQIMIDKEMVQNVRNPEATKALIHKLDLSNSFLISIIALSFSNSESLSAEIRYNPDNVKSAN